MKSVQIRSFSSVNVGKYGSEKTPYLHTFHAVSEIILHKWLKFNVTQEVENFWMKLNKLDIQ